MQRRFDQQIADLREKLLTMASHAETAVNRAVQALVERDDSLACRVEADDSVLDQFEVALDEICIELLALRAPVASDLRLITVAMKVSQNLERVGDEATKIARRVLELIREPPLKSRVDLPRMSQLAIEMLKGALDAFVNGDTNKAANIIRHDHEVDALNKQIHGTLVNLMLEDRQTITRCLNLMIVSKSLERIADHATNIAEEVVYLFEARDIRHATQMQPADRV